MLTTLGHANSIQFHHDGFEFNDGARPPHDLSLENCLGRHSADARIVYLDRDPRDVMVSLYHQVTGRFRDFFGYEGDISTFIRDDYFGAHVLARFRQLWADVLARRPYLRVSYENLHEDTAASLAMVLSHLGLDADPSQIAEAVELGRIDQMRRVELSGSFAEPWLRPRNGHPKVRRGEVGTYRDELSAADITYLNEVFVIDDID
jgi:hypothetical protein